MTEQPHEQDLTVCTILAALITQIQQDSSVAAATPCLYRFIRHSNTVQHHTFSFRVIVDVSVLVQLIHYSQTLL